MLALRRAVYWIEPDLHLLLQTSSPARSLQDPAGHEKAVLQPPSYGVYALTRVLIMAGGADEKWTRLGGKGRRHFAPILGEPLLHRTIRQIRSHGLEDIGIIAPDLPEYAIPGTWRIEPTTTAWGQEALNGRAFWSDTDRTIQVFGDTVFSNLAMMIICRYQRRAFQAFGYHRGRSGELFAFSFWPEHRDAWERAVRKSFELKAQGVIPRAGSWEGYRILCGAKGVDISKHRLYPRLFTNILDGTNDTDTPAKYEAMVRIVARRTKGWR
jgi:hypothetical protein